jgi:hypothetical protein
MVRPFERSSALACAAGLGSLAGGAVLTVVMTVVVPGPAIAQCSVFDRHPCAPTVCSVFRRGPCTPEFDYPIGQDLRLTIESKRADTASPGANVPAPESEGEQREPSGARKLDSIKDLFAALRGCWVPPAESDARPGMQMSVRLAFRRTGEIIGMPRVTYVSPNTPRDVRDRYHDAITQALGRCTPMPFTRGMGGAVAGRPIAIRFVDDRNMP